MRYDWTLASISVFDTLMLLEPDLVISMLATEM
jgi:hypothetical protein